ncbi:hypothetical protein [Micromonospora sp. NPDC047730]|uniref:hypothetical protein n=1 Tax=Micromonospora sp. NPDC047730 TaxID=3364253 RepID=UPI00371FD988
MKPLDPTRHHADGCHSEHAAWGPDGELIVAIGVGPIPKQGKYSPGDWVVMHGAAGMPPGNRRYGFRGMVLGGCGGGYYYGITDDGRQWFETAGALHRDGQRPRDTCTCCPWQPRKPAPAPAGKQLDLFPVTDLFGQPATPENL